MSKSRAQSIADVMFSELQRQARKSDYDDPYVGEAIDPDGTVLIDGNVNLVDLAQVALDEAQRIAK